MTHAEKRALASIPNLIKEIQELRKRVEALEKRRRPRKNDN